MARAQRQKRAQRDDWWVGQKDGQLRVRQPPTLPLHRESLHSGAEVEGFEHARMRTGSLYGNSHENGQKDSSKDLDRMSRCVTGATARGWGKARQRAWTGHARRQSVPPKHLPRRVPQLKPSKKHAPLPPERLPEQVTTRPNDHTHALQPRCRLASKTCQQSRTDRSLRARIPLTYFAKTGTDPRRKKSRTGAAHVSIHPPSLTFPHRRNLASAALSTRFEHMRLCPQAAALTHA
eukprot:157369-Pleurochrysis_carterae.AAC.2